MLVFVMQWLLLHRENLIIWSDSKRDAPFHRIAYDNYPADWNGFHDHLRDASWEDIFKISASAAASEFCE